MSVCNKEMRRMRDTANFSLTCRRWMRMTGRSLATYLWSTSSSLILPSLVKNIYKRLCVTCVKITLVSEPAFFLVNQLLYNYQPRLKLPNGTFLALYGKFLSYTIDVYKIIMT